MSFARMLGLEITPHKAGMLLRADKPERIMVCEMVDRWMTGEILVRTTLPARRERIDFTPVIDMIRIRRKYRNDATRIPFVRGERAPDGWRVEEGKTVVIRRNRRYELGRELKVHDPVDVWDERKVLWEDGRLK